MKGLLHEDQKASDHVNSWNSELVEEWNNIAAYIGTKDANKLTVTRMTIAGFLFLIIERVLFIAKTMRTELTIKRVTQGSKLNVVIKAKFN